MKKFLIVLCVIIFIILVLFGIYFAIYKKNRAMVMTGGRFELLFNTNGGEKIKSESVGIGVSPDSYNSLPIPVRNGYEFKGWYYDEKLSDKVKTESTEGIRTTAEYNFWGKQIGYKDVTLYAKWEEVEECSFLSSGDEYGGHYNIEFNKSKKEVVFSYQETHSSKEEVTKYKISDELIDELNQVIFKSDYASWSEHKRSDVMILDAATGSLFVKIGKKSYSIREEQVDSDVIFEVKDILEKVKVD